MRALGRHSPLASVLVAATLVASGPAADANGRFPAPTNVFPSADCTATDLWVSTTFGFLVSRDTGKSWSWVCEPAVGSGGPYDPILAVAPDGTLFTTTYTGMSDSSDKGCDFTHPGAVLANAWVSDEQLLPGSSKTLFVTTQTTGSGITNGVYQSTDGAATFAPLLASTNEYFKTIRLAPSNPLRIYVSSTAVMPVAGTPTFFAHVDVSSDGGKTWAVTDATYKGIAESSILAVNPTNPDEAYMRTEEGAAGPDGGYAYYVLKTLDAGKSWQPLLSLPEKANGIVTSEDGATLYVATLTGGLRVSTDDGATWSAASTTGPHLMCLAERCGHLYACGNNWSDKWAIGRSDDGGKSWTGLVHFDALCGPDATCAPTSAVQSTCTAMWPNLQSMFGSTCGGAVDAGGGPPPPSNHGCTTTPGSEGCTTTPVSDDRRGVLLLSLVILALAGIARRSRSRS